MAAPHSFLALLSNLRVGSNVIDDLSESSSIGRETVASFAEELSLSWAGHLRRTKAQSRPRWEGPRRMLPPPEGRFAGGSQQGIGLEGIRRPCGEVTGGPGVYNLEELPNAKAHPRDRRRWGVLGIRHRVRLQALAKGECLGAFACRGEAAPPGPAASSSGTIPEIEEALPALVVLNPLQQATLRGVPIVHADGLVDFITGAHGNSSLFANVKRSAGRPVPMRTKQSHL